MRRKFYTTSTKKETFPWLEKVCVRVRVCVCVSERDRSTSAGFKTTDGVNTCELGVMTLTGVSPKAPVLTVPMATAVSLRPTNKTRQTHIHLHGGEIIHTLKACSAHSSLYQLVLWLTGGKLVWICKHYSLPWDWCRLHTHTHVYIYIYVCVCVIWMVKMLQRPLTYIQRDGSHVEYVGLSQCSLFQFQTDYLQLQRVHYSTLFVLWKVLHDEMEVCSPSCYAHIRYRDKAEEN